MFYTETYNPLTINHPKDMSELELLEEFVFSYAENVNTLLEEYEHVKEVKNFVELIVEFKENHYDFSEEDNAVKWLFYLYIIFYTYFSEIYNVKYMKELSENIMYKYIEDRNVEEFKLLVELLHKNFSYLFNEVIIPNFSNLYQLRQEQLDAKLEELKKADTLDISLYLQIKTMKAKNEIIDEMKKRKLFNLSISNYKSVQKLKNKIMYEMFLKNIFVSYLDFEDESITYSELESFKENIKIKIPNDFTIKLFDIKKGTKEEKELLEAFKEFINIVETIVIKNI